MINLIYIIAYKPLNKQEWYLFQDQDSIKKLVHIISEPPH